jgi:hypothetical protein
MRAEHTPVSPDGEAGAEGGERMRSTGLIGIAASAVVAIGMSSGAQANLTSAFYRPVRKTKLTGRGCPLAFDLFSFRALMIGALVALALTTAISLYGALALALNAWPAVVVEFVLVMGFVWVLFIKPEPVV